MTGPLDLFPVARLAYSNRALSISRANTPLYTLRRSSDNATRVFNAALNGDAPTADISTFIGGGHGYVQRWHDQSGAGIDALGAVVADQAEWKASGPGSRPSIDGTSGNNPLFTNNPMRLLDGRVTVFGVVKNGARMLVGSNLDLSFGGVAHISLAASINTVSADYTPPGDVSAFAVWDGQITTGASDMMVNGAALTQAASNFQGTVGSFSATAQIRVLTSQSLAELIVFPYLLTPTERAAVRANIAAYYGITLATDTAAAAAVIAADIAAASASLVGVAAAAVNAQSTADTAVAAAATVAARSNSYVAAWSAGVNPNNVPIFVASVPCVVTGIRGRLEVAQGGAATARLVKAPSGTLIASGANLTSDTFNANGTAGATQTGTLTATGADLVLAAGDSIGIKTTGTWTNSVGALSVQVRTS